MKQRRLVIGLVIAGVGVSQVLWSRQAESPAAVAPQVVEATAPSAPSLEPPVPAWVARVEAEAGALPEPLDAGSTPPPATAADDSCEIIDGEPTRAETGDVLVRIVSNAAPVGQLKVHYEPPPDAGRGESMFVERVFIDELRELRVKTGRVSHERITLRRCRELSYRASLLLADGRAAQGGNWNHENPETLVLEPTRVARLKGRLVALDGGVGGAVLLLGKDHDVTDREGRFELNLVAQTHGDAEGKLELRAPEAIGAWSFADGEMAMPVRLRVGVLVDLGDIPVKLVHRHPPLGIRWGGEEGEAIVLSVASGSVGERSGLRPGDLVAEVDGVAVQSQRDALERLEGEPGTHARVKVRRESDYLLLDFVR